jgi:hypothetical protein
MRCLFLVTALALVPKPLPLMAQTRPASTQPGGTDADELHGLFDAQQYQQVVRRAAQVLGGKGAPTGEQRHGALVLKAEAHLRMGDLVLAARTFDEAAAAATDERAAAVDKSTAVLLRRAKRSGYLPKTGPAAEAREVLPVVEPDGRRLALKALYADERAAAAKKIDAAMSGDSVDALLDAAGLIAELRALELAAGGADDDSRKALADNSKRARELLRDRIKDMTDRAEAISKAANKKKKMGSAYRKRGLSREEIDELREQVHACRRLTDAAARLELVHASDAEAFEQVAKEAGDAARRADEILRADYGGLHEKD